MSRIIIATLVTLGCAVAFAADSGGYRGPKRDGIHPETGLLKAWPEGGPKLLWTWPRDPKTVWQEETGVGMGYSCATVAAGTVYCTGIRYDDGQKNLYAIALDLDGKVKWTTKLIRGLGCGRFEGPRATPEVKGGRLHFASGNGVLFCLDAETGKTKWSVDTREKFSNKVPGWGYNLSPLLVDDLVVAPIRRGDYTMVALDNRTGELVWGSEPTTYAIGDTSPVLVEHAKMRMVVCNLWHAIVGVDPTNGKIVWRKEGPAGTVLTPVFHKGRLLVDVEKKFRLWKPQADGKDFDEVWQKTGINGLAQTVILDDRVYAIAGNALASYDLNTGKPVKQMPCTMHARSLVAADGMLYLIETDGKAPDNGRGKYGETGRISLVKPTEGGFEVVGSLTPLVGTKELYVAPTIAEGRLFHRHGHLLAVYDIRASAGESAQRTANHPGLGAARSSSRSDTHRKLELSD